MQITQGCPCPAFGDMTATWQSWWWPTLHCCCMHIPPCVSSQQDHPGAPHAQTGPHSSGCNTEGSAAHCPMVPAWSLPRRSQTWSWPGALSHPKPQLSPFPDRGRQSRRHLGLPQRVFTILMSTQLFMPQASTVGLVISHYQALASPPCNG